MASFNGVLIFGIAVTMKRETNPRALQQNTYPAQDGIESLDQGSRGQKTVVAGRLYGGFGGGMAGLNSAILLFESYKDGRAYVLVDQFGNAWPNVKLEAFEPEGRISNDPYYGATQRYQALFDHLT